MRRIKRDRRIQGECGITTFSEAKFEKSSYFHKAIESMLDTNSSLKLGGLP